MPVDLSIQSLLAPADSSFTSPVKASASDGARREESNGENGERSGSDSDGNAKVTSKSAHGMASLIIDWLRHGTLAKIDSKLLKSAATSSIC